MNFTPKLINPLKMTVQSLQSDIVIMFISFYSTMYFCTRFDLPNVGLAQYMNKLCFDQRGWCVSGLFKMLK